MSLPYIVGNYTFHSDPVKLVILYISWKSFFSLFVWMNEYLFSLNISFRTTAFLQLELV